MKRKALLETAKKVGAPPTWGFRPLIENIDLVHAVWLDPNEPEGIGTLIVKGENQLRRICASGRGERVGLTAFLVADAEQAAALKRAAGEVGEYISLEEIPDADMHNARQTLDRLLEKGIKPHADEIAELTAKHRFVAVVFEPGARTAAAARTFGWDGSSPIFPLSKRAVNQLAQTDRVAQRWFATKPDLDHAKLFVLMHEGNLLLNHESEQGWYIEPGSTDAGLRQAGGIGP